jgi:L-asparaginase
VAGAAESRGLGSLIVFEQEIHAARDGTKTHTSQVRTFQSAEHGKLGEVDQGRVVIHRKPLIRTRLHCTRIEPRVDLVKLCMGADRRFIDCAVSSGARGLVVEAFGRGNVTPDVLQGVDRAIAAGISVLVTSRCPRGRVEPVYGGSGGVGLANAGAEFMGDLSGVKARILLAVLLGDTVIDGTISDALRRAAA